MNYKQSVFTFDKAKKKFFYNPKTGKLYRMEKSGLYFREVGTATKYGYMAVEINGIAYPVHRIIWLYSHGEWPVGQIDHIDGNRANNKIENLRDVSQEENNKNKRMAKNNTSGCVGVYWRANTKKWQASISINDKNKHLGFYDDFELAELVRKEAELHYGYHKNHGREYGI